MAEEYVLPQPETLSISLHDADKLISAGSGDAALLYLYILRRHGNLDRETARAELGMGDKLDAAMGTLQKLGLVRQPGGSAALRIQDPQKLAPGSSPDIPVYTVSEVQRAAEDAEGFRSLLDEAAKRLGRILSGNDMMVLFGLYDYLGLPPEVILVIINWCTQELERRYGPGKRPTLRQIEKEAYIWQERGILTLELAEKHVQELLDRRKESSRIQRSLGIRDRLLSPSEEKYIQGWIDMGFSPEAVLEAYDRTILKKKELVWPYMNRILENWHKRELHEREAILKADPRERGPAREKTAGEAASAGPAAEEYRRMQRYLEKMNGGGGNDA